MLENDEPTVNEKREDNGLVRLGYVIGTIGLCNLAFWGLLWIMQPFLIATKPPGAFLFVWFISWTALGVILVSRNRTSKDTWWKYKLQPSFSFIVGLVLVYLGISLGGAIIWNWINIGAEGGWFAPTVLIICTIFFLVGGALLTWPRRISKQNQHNLIGGDITGERQ